MVIGGEASREAALLILIAEKALVMDSRHGTRADRLLLHTALIFLGAVSAAAALSPIRAHHVRRRSVLAKIRAREEIAEAVTGRAEIDRCRLAADDFNFVLCDRETWLGCLSAGAAHPLHRVLAELATTNFPVAFQHATIRGLPWQDHPLALLDEDAGAEVLGADRSAH